MKIKFLGATKNVTGSKFLLQIDGKNLLVDCGLFQERELKNRNWEEFPVDIEKIDCILLSHAHLDHSGYIPKIVKDGFSGKIYCTYPTSEITKIALLDSAKLQVEDAEKKRKRHQKEGRKGPYPEIPLYDVSDAEKSFHLFEPINYNEVVEISDKIKVVFYNSGHILGSSLIKIYVNGKEIVFSGDLGREGSPLLHPPEIIESADILILESTYGDRIHEEREIAIEKLENIINETVKKGGNIVIPTFAIERAQEILYYLKKLLIEDRIPHILTFLDSPMAIEVTEVFKKYLSYIDGEAEKIIEKNISPFDFPLLHFTKTVEESKMINHIKGSTIIMAGSGMCTGGRIKHHLISNIEREESSILFVGYQAKGTLGREIIEKEEVRILGNYYKVRAKIEKIDGFSAHADKGELLKWLDGFKKFPEKLFLVHGEEETIENFAETIKKAHTDSEIIIPSYLDEYEI
ncbi:MAG: MBL fold metallo-hydrolase [Candidatus Omnitrophica bacterium]|nr:MBL fold metallo-hydrolase [Candidatus Omnitrophota bacterium]MCM8807558.1 MBL fold metallo-hydrolase [Candidatus Omnitrophota bacterium]